MNKQVTVKAGSKKPVSSMKKIKHMSITPADDGTFMSETRHAASPEEMKAGMYDYDSTTKKCTHQNAEELAEHVRSTFGGKAPAKGEGSKKHEKSESKAEKKAEGDDY